MEEAAARLPLGAAAALEACRDAQYRLWTGLRAQGNPWLITDFVSVGTPMYFADVLGERSPRRFKLRVRRCELPTCPLQNEERSCDTSRPRYAYPWRGREVLHGAAPFAVARWSNLWFPSAPGWCGGTGDWFGGPLQPLFSRGIRDVRVTGNKPLRLLPAWAHALYFKFPDDDREDSVTSHLATAMDLRDSLARDPHLRPTDAQLDAALDLLNQVGLSTGLMTEAHTDLMDPRQPLPVEPVRDWLSGMTRSQIACLITDLRRRARKRFVSAPLDPEQ